MNKERAAERWRARKRDGDRERGREGGRVKGERQGRTQWECKRQKSKSNREIRGTDRETERG